MMEFLVAPVVVTCDEHVRLNNHTRTPP